jgi:hypothetical protein
MFYELYHLRYHKNYDNIKTKCTVNVFITVTDVSKSLLFWVDWWHIEPQIKHNGDAYNIIIKCRKYYLTIQFLFNNKDF